ERTEMIPIDRYVHALKDAVEEFDTASEEFEDAVEEILQELREEAREEGYSEGYGDANGDLEVW
ncbi:MAG: hypothetical protein LOD87_07820, partial [Planifilum fulgidum]